MMAPALKCTRMKWRNFFIFQITVLAVHPLCEYEHFVAAIASLFVCLFAFFRVDDVPKMSEGQLICCRGHIYVLVLHFKLITLFIFHYKKTKA